jgi:predicted transcriptional regulator
MRYKINLEFLRQDILKKQQGELRTLVTLQYPVICCHAEILDSTPDALDRVDRLILSLVKNIDACNHNTLYEFSNLERSLIKARVIVLVKDGVLKILPNSSLTITEKGIDFLSGKNAIIEKFRNVDFYFDGINLLPLKKEFVRRYGESFVSSSDGYHIEIKEGDSEVLKWISSFRPDIVHQTISIDKLRDIIDGIEIQQREEFGIPSGLKRVVRYTFTNLTFPLLIGLADKGEVANKFIVNGMDFYGKTEDMGNFKLGLEKRINAIQIRLAQRTKEDKLKLTSNWDIIDKADTDVNRIFNIPNEDLKLYIEKELALNDSESDRALSKERINEIKLWREDILKSDDPKGLIEHFVRGRHSIYGNPYSSSVYQFWVNIEPGDQFMVDLKNLMDIIKAAPDDLSEKADLVSNSELDAKRLREMLILSGNRQVLEELDIREYIN